MASWHVLDKQPLDCWREACSYEIMPIRSSDADEIVLHHINQGHGSGFVQDETQVLTIAKGKFLRTLATSDYFLSEAMAGFGTDEKQSTFLRFPDGSLEETRTSAINDKLKKVERRYWRWSDQKNAFRSTRFVLVTMPGA